MRYASSPLRSTTQAAVASYQYPFWNGNFRRSRRWKCRITDELDSAIGLFDHCGAALDPVPAIIISDVGDLMNGGTMNVAAQNSINPKLLGIADDRLFEFADEAYCVFHPLLRVSAERPIAESKSPAYEIDRRIE